MTSKHRQGREDSDGAHDVVLEIALNPRTNLWEILAHDFSGVSVFGSNHDLSKMTCLAKLMSDTLGVAYGGVRGEISDDAA